MRLMDLPSRVVEWGLEFGASDVVAHLIDSDHTMIRFSNNEVTISKNYREAAISIFVMVGKHRAGSELNVIAPKEVEKAVKDIIKMAKMSPPSETYAPLPEGPFQYNPRLLRSSKVSLHPEQLAGYVEEAVNSALEAGAKRVAGSLIASNFKTHLETSAKASATYEGSSLEISVRAFVSEVASGHFVSISRRERDFHPEEAGRMAGEISRIADKPVTGKPGKYTALLGPLVFADFVNQMGHSASAFLVETGQSFLIEKLGEQVASENLTIIDDPTLEDTYGAKPFDDEGVPTRRNVIVEKGILKTYLHNSTTAKRFKTETTANAGLVVPYPMNLTVEAGKEKFEKMLDEIDRGIYVTNNWYLRYQNYQTGDFSTIPRDGMFLIENGAITRPIKELRISDNLPRIFQNVRALSDQRVWVKWWEVDIPTLTPFAVVEELNFTKSTL